MSLYLCISASVMLLMLLVPNTSAMDGEIYRIDDVDGAMDSITDRIDAERELRHKEYIFILILVLMSIAWIRIHRISVKGRYG
ncbi:hypothetical protein GQ472_06160 [archaeon]|nr:hypothetical protein [archaeon]